MKKYNKLFLIIISFGFLFLVFRIPRMIPIREISCQNQFNIKCKESLLESFKKLEGENLHSAKLGAEKLFTEDVSIKGYTIQFSFPNKLIIDVIEKKAVFAVFDELKNTYFLVDRGGEVIEISNNTNLPYLVVGEIDYAVGDKVDDPISFALDVVNELYFVYGIGSGKLVGQSLEAILKDGKKVIFPLEGDVNKLIASLDLILRRLNSESENSNISSVDKVRTIDLRFEKPVLK